MGRKQDLSIAERLYQVDLQLAVRIYAVFGHSKAWRLLWEFFSLTGDGILWLLIVLPLLAIASFVGALRDITDGQKAFLYFFYMCQFVDIVCIVIFKLIFRRQRPPHHKSDDRFVGPDQHSFPSGHATRSWCLVALIFYLAHYYPSTLSDMLGAWSIRSFPTAMIFWALIICFSRLALGRHYPSDILAGGAIGFFLEFAISAALMQYVFPVLLASVAK
ncbi:phosphatidic acid phosphatase [Achlya hypogyna]|uniref:Phosphatidic acid phosphatase n=1 Tax=Achlya hypogyna TaxID=1202772 RepID=A0A1V9ZUB3_ACHHY|nr:phosphatidic acid phosphatase [Achlya hypogyna]